MFTAQAKAAHQKQLQDQQQMDVDETAARQPQTVQARLVSETGEEAGPPIDLPAGVTAAQLGLICNALLQNVREFHI